MSSPARLALALALAGLVACLAVALPADAGKDRKKGGGNKTRTFSSGAVNLPIPDDAPGPARGTLNSTIEVDGKALKGRRIEDVNLNVRVSHQGIFDLTARLIAPNGAGIFVIVSTNGTSWGTGSPDCDGTFMTLDDETPVELFPNTGTPPPGDWLAPPYGGVARPSLKPLSVMDGGPIKGTWRLTLFDFDPPNVGTLHCWEVVVKPRRRGEGR